MKRTFEASMRVRGCMPSYVSGDGSDDYLELREYDDGPDKSLEIQRRNETERIIASIIIEYDQIPALIDALTVLASLRKK